MIMGAGKTTVVSPLLALLLANAETLVVNVSIRCELIIVL
jgi:hypothetical protein